MTILFIPPWPILVSLPNDKVEEALHKFKQANGITWSTKNYESKCNLLMINDDNDDDVTYCNIIIQQWLNPTLRTSEPHHVCFATASSKTNQHYKTMNSIDEWMTLSLYT